MGKKFVVDVAEYELMHKDRVVATVYMDEDYMNILGIKKVYSEKDVPLGIREKPDKKSPVNRNKLRDWWSGRVLPATRRHIQDALHSLGVSVPSKLLEYNFGLSLSDSYWARPAGRNDLSWDSLNFYNNDFVDDLGYYLVEDSPSSVTYAKEINLFTPDGTTNGDLIKGWIISDGNRFLLKRGYTPAQDANEIIASEICKRLGIPHAEYTAFRFSNLTVSASLLFTSESVEYIPMISVIDSLKASNSLSAYEHSVAACVDLGIPEEDVRKGLEQMLVVDYLTKNYDRHYGNFGVLRNVDTGEFIGMAPVFDTGSSFRFVSREDSIGGLKVAECKPYRSTHDKQIEYVKDLCCYDFDSLSDMKAFIENTYETFGLDKESLECKDAVRIFENQLDKIKNLQNRMDCPTL